MGIVTFFQNIVVSVLVAYLSFTNMLAGHIESFFGETNTPPVATAPHESENTFVTVESTGRESKKIFDFLKTHEGFQRAAVIASERDEEEVPLDTRPLDEVVQDALVNVYCQYKTDKYIRTTTGTGFFINQKGVILTNAHVAQFLLLTNRDSVVDDVTCTIRSGNPAKARYEAKLLYISPRWIFDNSEVITEEAPRGTGERDYALLYVSRSLDTTPLPAHFPAIAVDTALLSRGVEGGTVTTAGYPAGALFRYGADAELSPVLAETKIGMLYTFGSNYADLFSISESPVGEQGASGGPIVWNDSKSVIGLIVTKGDTKTEGEHSLRALTLSYIDRTMKEETGFSLKENMQGDLALRGGIFGEAMVPFLAGILEAELRGNN